MPALNNKIIKLTIKIIASFAHSRSPVNKLDIQKRNVEDPNRQGFNPEFPKTVRCEHETTYVAVESGVFGLNYFYFYNCFLSYS